MDIRNVSYKVCISKKIYTECLMGFHADIFDEVKINPRSLKWEMEWSLSTKGASTNTFTQLMLAYVPLWKQKKNNWKAIMISMSRNKSCSPLNTLGNGNS